MHTLRSCSPLLAIVVAVPLLLGGIATFALPQQAANETPLSLDDDRRVATVKDREGVALLRKLRSSRWVALNASSPLHAGDWIKTGSRGANALRFQLANNTSCVLGPKGLVELSASSQLKLLSGELTVPEAESQTEEALT